MGNEDRSDAIASPVQLGVIGRFRQRMGRPAFMVAAVVVTATAIAGAWWAIHEVRCRMLASRIREFLEYDGEVTFDVHNLEPRTASGIDFTSVVESISIKSFYSTRDEISVGCSEAISVCRPKNEIGCILFCEDFILFRAGGVTYDVKLDNNIPHGRLVTLSPWTRAEYEAVWLPGAWERITAE